MVEPYLFSSDRRLVAAIAGPGHASTRVGAVVVDWERRGKSSRQADAVDRIGIDTQINTDEPTDLVEVAALSTAPVLCRINPWTKSSPDEVELAIACGASEVIIPMVRSGAEVTAALDAANDRIGVGIMVETIDATLQADRLAALPITRAFLGLMDLALERGSQSIFDAVADGTVERVRTAFDVPFGFGGLTVPGGGSPVPVELLAAEMVRLGCSFSFLRRSFISDSSDTPARGVQSIREMVSKLASRTGQEVERDHEALMMLLGSDRLRVADTSVAS